MPYKLTFATFCKRGSSIFLMNQKDRGVLAESWRVFPQSREEHQRHVPASIPRVLYKFPVFVHLDTFALAFARNSFP